jgi:hypothetical protein
MRQGNRQPSPREECFKNSLTDPRFAFSSFGKSMAIEPAGLVLQKN